MARRRERPAPGNHRRGWAWGLMAVALSMLVTGLVLAQGLLLAAGLVTAGVAAHLLSPPQGCTEPRSRLF